MREAYIFDIDGTLAIRGGRSPFDYSKVELDTPNIGVITTLKALYKGCYDIIITSGREDTCKDATVQWLHKNLGIKGFDLFMRKAGDFRKDAIIKQEIYEQYIEPRWKIVAVFDDRDQVVEMWRRLGLSCYQVNYGNF